MNHTLREQVRLAAGRKAEPTAAIIDSQTVKISRTGLRSTRSALATEGISSGEVAMDCRTYLWMALQKLAIK